MKHSVVIIGASGYIGRHLVARLKCLPGFQVRALCRSRQQGLDILGSGINVEIIEGSLDYLESLRDLIEPGCTVINLAYLWNVGEDRNITAIRNLLEACRAANVRRLIHCSTADVAGRTRDNPITENSACQPVSNYSIVKHKIERTILNAAHNNFDIAILRPTAVFGPGGRNLKKLVDDLVGGNRFLNYLKSCLFGSRRMNLVHVANVVAAILFLIDRQEDIDGEAFIVSDDDAIANNFGEVERTLMRLLDCPDYALPRIFFPQWVLSLLLRLLGRNSINPGCNYAQNKLQNIGFSGPVIFEDGLIEYTNWYRSRYFVKLGSEAK